MKYSPAESGHFDGQRGYGYVSIEKFIDAAAAVNAGASEAAEFDQHAAVKGLRSQFIGWSTKITEMNNKLDGLAQGQEKMLGTLGDISKDCLEIGGSVAAMQVVKRGREEESQDEEDEKPRKKFRREEGGGKEGEDDEQEEEEVVDEEEEETEAGEATTEPPATQD